MPTTIPALTISRMCYVSGTLTATGDQTNPAAFLGPQIGVTVTGTFTGSLSLQKRPKSAALTAWQTVRVFVPADFTANVPTQYVPNVAMDEEWQLVATSIATGGPLTVYMSAGAIQ